MTPITDGAFGRRDLLVTGGTAALLGSLLAACGGSEGELGRVGTGEPAPELPSETVDDSVLLRTSASIERSIAAAYERIAAEGLLSGTSATYPDLGDQSDLIALLAEHHADAANRFDDLTIAAGGEAWDCGNPRLDSVFIDVVFDRIQKGAAATDAAPAIEPSDDPVRDVINLVYALESLSTETCQAMVPQVTSAEYRTVLMQVGHRSSRHAALVALTANPTGFLPSSGEAETSTTEPEGDAPPQTPIPLPVAAPSTFGSLAPVTYIGGFGDENGVRLKLNFETPSLNSLVYADATCG